MQIVLALFVQVLRYSQYNGGELNLVSDEHRSQCDKFALELLSTEDIIPMKTADTEVSGLY